MLVEFERVDEECEVMGALLARKFETVKETSAARTITSSDYGKIIFLNYAGAVAVTLPTNGAAIGSTFACVIDGSDSCAPVFTASAANTLITFNNKTTCDSVTFGSGHRVGAMVVFISTGSYWVAVSPSALATMTVTTA
jgi:hypothetical protein